MQRRYRRVVESSQSPETAVVVHIRWKPGILPVAEPTATIKWSTAVRRGDAVLEASEGPFEVEDALAGAEGLRKLYGLDCVMVSIASAELWRTEWGEPIED